MNFRFSSVRSLRDGGGCVVLADVSCPSGT